MSQRLPICVDCQIDMMPLKNNFVVEIMAGAEPYQKVAADKFGCPNCNIEVVVGFAPKPLAESWQAHYGVEKADLRAWCTLKDKATFDKRQTDSVAEEAEAEYHRAKRRGEDV